MGKKYLIAGSGSLLIVGLIYFLAAINIPLLAAGLDFTATVDINTDGFDPASLTVEPGVTVLWTNRTGQPVHFQSGYPYQIYLPLILHNVGPPSPVSLAPELTLQQHDWADETIAAGQSFSHTFTTAGAYPYFLPEDRDQVGLVQVELLPEEENIPCLVVVGQPLAPASPPIFAGCVAGPKTIVWRYDNRGAIIGFDLTVEDTGSVIYQASIDLQRAPSGRILSYSGTVGGNGFPAFTQSVVNQYNPYGGLTGAEATKLYTASQNQYLMQITDYCPLPTVEMSGYKVLFDGEEIPVGLCP